MADYKYSFQQYNKETMARSHGVSLQISLKKTVEISNEIRGKKISFIEKYLNEVIVMKKAVPYRRYNTEMPHRKGKGIAAGGYPVFVAKEVLKLIIGAKKNASELEIEGELYLLGISCRKGSSKYHYGRYSGRKMKSTTVEIIVGVKDTKGGKNKK